MQPKFHKICGALALASILFVSACTKMDAPAPSPDADADGKISYEMTATNPSSTISGDAAGIERLATITNNPSMAKTSGSFDFTWTEVMVRVREVKFAAKKGNDEVEFKLKTDRMVDVLEAIGFLGMIEIPRGTYEHVKVAVKIAGDEENPAAIMKGFITWEGNDIPFSVRLAGEVNLKAHARDVMVTDTSLSFKGKLQLDLKVVMAKLQIGDFTGSFSGGELVINVHVNDKTGKKVKEGLEGCMRAEHKRD
ncbi:hypothetical protein [Chitinophaga japonensis]|uniref:DUF4382 domain-containing protein n=1 Tax=Chitinophaga japonensis TaxID=104662 RepID=A0A562TFG7_CHIJA|nr:hypothetical protein [Chitinophaga japonensis]TWI92281.1 hypothetical protein LX66_1666 [Chitinophaga japonensis]